MTYTNENRPSKVQTRLSEGHDDDDSSDDISDGPELVKNNRGRERQAGERKTLHGIAKV